jgi:hemin uptake protein HemP
VFQVIALEWPLNPPNIPGLAPPVTNPLCAPNPPIESSTLFQGRQEVVICHDGHEYRLRITRQNKLILTK